MSCNWVPATQETRGGLLPCATDFGCHSSARSLPTGVFLVAALVTKPSHSTRWTPSSRANQAASACRILSILVGWGLRSQGDGEGGACVTPPPRAGRLAAARRKLEAGAELATDCATEPRRVPGCCCAARLPRLAVPVAVLLAPRPLQRSLSAARIFPAPSRHNCPDGPVQRRFQGQSVLGVPAALRRRERDRGGGGRGTVSVSRPGAAAFVVSQPGLRGFPISEAPR